MFKDIGGKLQSTMVAFSNAATTEQITEKEALKCHEEMEQARWEWDQWREAEPAFAPGRGVAGLCQQRTRTWPRTRRRGEGGGNMFRATGLTGWQRAAMNDSAAAGSDAAMPTKQQEVKALKQQATVLAEMLNNIRQRIDKIES